MTAPVFRPSFEKTLRDLHSRVRILEAVPDTGGGGVSATNYERFSSTLGTTTMPATGARVKVTWTHAAGLNLLNLAVPTIPVFIAAGVYAITVTVECITSSSTAVGGFVAEMLGLPSIVVATTTMTTHVTSSSPSGGVYNPSIALAAVMPIAAGTSFSIGIGQGSGSSQDGGIAGALIQKLS